MQAHLSPQDCDLEQFSQQVERQLTIQNVPQAHDIQKNVPIYDIGQLDLTGDTAQKLQLQCCHLQWYTCREPCHGRHVIVL